MNAYVAARIERFTVRFSSAIWVAALTILLRSTAD
jgi:hypothetical protein